MSETWLHIATLEAEMERLHAQAESCRADLERERERGNKATAETIETAARLIETERALSKKSLEALTATHEAMSGAVKLDRLRLEGEMTEKKNRQPETEPTQPWWMRFVG